MSDVTISHPDTPRRAFFSGPLKDAREYIEKNYPRHSHDGNGGQIVSAQINHADGGVSTYHDGEWSDPVSEHESEPVEPAEPTDPDAPAFEYPVV